MRQGKRGLPVFHAGAPVNESDLLRLFSDYRIYLQTSWVGGGGVVVVGGEHRMWAWGGGRGTKDVMAEAQCVSWDSRH